MQARITAPNAPMNTTQANGMPPISTSATMPTDVGERVSGFLSVGLFVGTNVGGVGIAVGERVAIVPPGWEVMRK